MGKKMIEALVRARKGRPVTGKAKSSTERGKAADEALIAAGGRILSRVRLSPEAAAALFALSEVEGGDRSAIEKALIETKKSLQLSLRSTIIEI